MREPERPVEGGAAAYEAGEGGGPQPVPGGKALARLIYFQEQRGVAAPEEPDVPEQARVEPEVLLEPVGGPAAGPGPFGAAAALEVGAPARSRYLRAFRSVQEAGPPGGALAFALEVPRGWQPLGPYCIPHGQTYGSGRGSRPPVAGRVSSLAVDPDDPDHLLIGAGGGGIWESRDRGATWHARTDEAPSLSIGAVAFDPSNPRRVYAGTGEGDTFSWLGVGLLRSTDGGASWALHAEDPFQGMSFFDLVVDPADGDHLLAGTSHGLFKSTDGGAGWSRRRSAMTWSLSVAGDEALAGCRDGAFRSTDGGATWQRIDLAALGAQPQRVEVCHAPSDAGVAYVVAAAQGRPLFWRRGAAGSTFTAIDPPPDIDTGQAWYDWFAAVAPDDPDLLWVGAIDVHRGRRSGGGGWSWQKVSARSGDATSIHPDQHAIAFDPADPARVYVGNDGGIYASDDRGGVWESLNQGLSITEFEFLAQHTASDAWLLAGTQDNGTLRYEGYDLWHHVQDGDGGDCGADAADPYTCYHTFYGMGMERSTTGGGWGTWQRVGPRVPASENYRGGALFYPPLEVRDRLVVQAGKSVWISTDAGSGDWEQVRLPDGAGLASALALPSAARIYVGTENGRIYRLDRDGAGWSGPEELAAPTSGFISDLLVDPSDPDRLWATCSDLASPGVFRSDDGGAAWQRLVAGLPAIPINAIAVDPSSPDTVFVAADVGVHRSFDAGASWSSFSVGLPNALVKDLVFHAPSRLLRAATQSRGVWEIAVDELQMPDVEVFLRDSVADTGRRVPSPSGVDDPFVKGQKADWWTCPDLKVDAEPFVVPALDDLDEQLFGDDRELRDRGIEFSAGLRHGQAVRGATARVYVRAHNRGMETAREVTVKVFSCALGDGRLPELGDGFWDDFPDSAPPAGSPWSAVADHRVIPRIERGRAAVVGFEWDVLADAPDWIVLLAVVSADNDEIATSETRVGVLVPGNTKCGLRVVEIDAGGG